MKVGDLVRTRDGRVMVVVKTLGRPGVRERFVGYGTIYTLHDGKHYPAYNLELVNESRETTQKE